MRNILRVFVDAAMMASATTTSANSTIAAASTTTTVGTTTIAGTSTTTDTTVNKTKIIQIHDKREEIEKYNGKGMRALHNASIQSISMSLSSAHIFKCTSITKQSLNRHQTKN